MKLFSYRRRPPYLGPFPMERIERVSDHRSIKSTPEEAPPAHVSGPTNPGRLADSFDRYLRLYQELGDGPVAEKRAPLPDTPIETTRGIKGACYFLDASMVGTCGLTDEMYSPDCAEARHHSALLILVEHSRLPEPGTVARSWIAGNEQRCASLRALEIGTVIAGFIRNMGFAASCHVQSSRGISLDNLAVQSGLAEWRAGRLENPFVGSAFELAAVTTGLVLEPDLPLAPNRNRWWGLEGGLRFLLGWGGTTSRLERWLQSRRKTELSRFPMESIRRVDKPTTLIFDDEVPRVPKRAGFFERARRGDLGDKAERESRRFATKHPLTRAMVPLMKALVPFQDGDVAPHRDTGETQTSGRQPDRNATAVKSLAYFLGTDLVGICEAKPYSWYSHTSKGTPIDARHKNAIVFLIDQGHETMEGASGDDWMSGAQSMRGYLRGSEITGVVANHIRSLGYSARAHTNADSEVLHIPLVLLAGLGELSRIGELVLNPFVGPRFKSAVVTTDMPLAHDRPIDFGLQDMCNQCMKCARECPVNAISYGDKVIFNGYEMWKPDVERCTRYRVTNPHGSACGRCMKMCPYTNEGLLMHRFFLKCAIHLPFTRRWIARLDDIIGNGRRNLIKKWWWDHEWLPEGWAVEASRTNRRDLHIGKDKSVGKNHQIAYYHADDMPPPDVSEPMPLDRKRALEAARVVETPAGASARRRTDGKPPAHYQATLPLYRGRG